jgi:hypothetical protein
VTSPTIRIETNNISKEKAELTIILGSLNYQTGLTVTPYDNNVGVNNSPLGLGWGASTIQFRWAIKVAVCSRNSNNEGLSRGLHSAIKNRNFPETFERDSKNGFVNASK